MFLQNAGVKGTMFVLLRGSQRWETYVQEYGMSVFESQGPHYGLDWKLTTGAWLATWLSVQREIAVIRAERSEFCERAEEGESIAEGWGGGNWNKNSCRKQKDSVIYWRRFIHSLCLSKHTQRAGVIHVHGHPDYELSSQRLLFYFCSLLNVYYSVSVHVNLKPNPRISNMNKNFLDNSLLYPYCKSTSSFFIYQA